MMKYRLLSAIGTFGLAFTPDITRAGNEDAVAPELLTDLVTTAVKNGSFQTLAQALTSAGLVEALHSPDINYTVFAPTDEAFGALPESILNWLLTEDGKSTLTDILLYHVIGTEIFSDGLSDGLMAATLQGSEVTFTIGETVQVNDATVIIPNVDATNGVIHVIDSK